MLWAVLLLAALVVLAWGMYPRPVEGAEGRGADESQLSGPVCAASVARVGTFNIHGGKGRDGRRDLRRTALDLKKVDIAALLKTPLMLQHGLNANPGVVVADQIPISDMESKV